MNPISSSEKLYECKNKPLCCSAHCYYANYDYLFRLGKIVCSKPNEFCKWQHKIKTYLKN